MTIACNSAYFQTETLNFTFARQAVIVFNQSLFQACAHRTSSKKRKTRDYFDATASTWNTSTHRAPWRVSLYKDGQSNRRVGVF